MRSSRLPVRPAPPAPPREPTVRVDLPAELVERLRWAMQLDAAPPPYGSSDDVTDVTVYLVEALEDVVMRRGVRAQRVRAAAA